MTPGGFELTIGVGVTVEITGFGVGVTGFFWVLLVELGVAVGEAVGASVTSGSAVGFPLGRNAKKEKRTMITSEIATKNLDFLLTFQKLWRLKKPSLSSTVNDTHSRVVFIRKFLIIAKVNGFFLQISCSLAILFLHH
jgi:hypothetical protein